jgi:hypothetical protein
MNLWDSHKELTLYAETLIGRINLYTIEKSEGHGFATEAIMNAIDLRLDNITFAQLKKDVSLLLNNLCKEHIPTRISNLGTLINEHNFRDAPIDTTQYCHSCKDLLPISKFGINKQGFNQYVKPVCNSCEWKKYKEKNQSSERYKERMILKAAKQREKRKSKTAAY